MDWEEKFLSLIKTKKLVDTKAGTKEIVGVIFVDKVKSFINQTLIDQIKEIRSRHGIPMNSATDIILTRIEADLKEKTNGQ